MKAYIENFIAEIQMEFLQLYQDEVLHSSPFSEQVISTT